MRQPLRVGAPSECAWATSLCGPQITVVMRRMAIAHSRLTAQGQISVPVEVRRRLGVGPGSILEWDEEGSTVVVRRAGRVTSEQIHDAIFGEGAPPSRTLQELKQGPRRHVKRRHARG